VHRILSDLSAAGLVAAVKREQGQEEGWQPARDIHEITVAEFLDALDRGGSVELKFPQTDDFQAISRFWTPRGNRRRFAREPEAPRPVTPLLFKTVDRNIFRWVDTKYSFDSNPCRKEMRVMKKLACCCCPALVRKRSQPTRRGERRKANFYANITAVERSWRRSPPPRE
jgi:hypothetical protein